MAEGGAAVKSETRVAYRLCPRCFRAVPLASNEQFCANDGMPLLEACPKCGSSITSPYARYCVVCGLEFSSASARTRSVLGPNTEKDSP